jgi:hypothetical protein
MIEVREATQTGQEEYALVKVTPWRWSVSVWGVRSQSGARGGVVSYRCWSVVTSTTLGRSGMLATSRTGH